MLGRCAPTGSELDEHLPALKPDVVLIHDARWEAHILECSRPWDRDLSALRESETGKRGKYTPHIEALRQLLPGWSISLTTVIAGVRGTVNEGDIRTALSEMKLGQPKIEQVLLATF